jgi:protein-L-isoaspartate(D-aspartate) O-methyltransferase
MATKLNEFTSAEMRSAMIDCQLRPTNVSDAGVIAAMRAIPREDFVPAALAGVAYMDRPVALNATRVLNAPLVTGTMLVQANVQAGERVLLIGAGTGYVAALLAQLGAQVVALEEDADLIAAAPESVKTGAIQWVAGSLAQGAADHAPYALILIDGAIEELPAAIIAQLADGGRLIAARKEGSVDRLVSGVKSGGTISLRRFADMDVAPLAGFEAPKTFQF